MSGRENTFAQTYIHIVTITFRFHFEYPPLGNFFFCKYFVFFFLNFFVVLHNYANFLSADAFIMLTTITFCCGDDYNYIFRLLLSNTYHDRNNNFISSNKQANKVCFQKIKKFDGCWYEIVFKNCICRETVLPFIKHFYFNNETLSGNNSFFWVFLIINGIIFPLG